MPKLAYVNPFTEWPKTTVDLQSIPETNLKFIFEQASTRLKDSLSAGDTLRAKAYNFISVIIVIFSAIASFYLNNFSTANTIITNVSQLALAYLFLTGWYLIQVIKPSRFHSVGTEPSVLFKRNLIVPQQEEESEISEKMLLFDQIAHYDKRIFINKQENEQKGRVVKNSIWALLAFPPAMIALYLLFKFISLCL